MMGKTISGRLAFWACGANFSGLPADVVHASKLRILDTLGLALLGRDFDVGCAALQVGRTCGETGAASVIGGPDRLPAATAALVNGVLAEAIEFDDSHNETVVHASTPVVSAALALAEAERARGSEVLRAVSVGVEVACRTAVGAPGDFHPRGFHPTGIFGTFGAAAAGAILLGLDERRFSYALGLAGSFASGILESWSDGTWGKLSHPGWSAQAGVWAARLAAQDFSGPIAVFEGKHGLFATHIQGAEAPCSLDRITGNLGEDWESRNISFKPYPNAHVMHGVQDAMFALLDENVVRIDDIARVTAFVAPYMVNLVCEPENEKRRPPSEAQARISLAHTLAEIILFREMGAAAYSREKLADPRVMALADLCEYKIREDWTGRTVYPGGVCVELKNGQRLQRFEEANLGSIQKPMSKSDIEGKFSKNSANVLSQSGIETIMKIVDCLEDHETIYPLMRELSGR